MGHHMYLLLALTLPIVLVSGQAASGDADTATVDLSNIAGYPDSPSDCSTASDGHYCILSNKCEEGPGQCKAGQCVGKPKQCNDYYDLSGADGIYKSKDCTTYACNPKTGKCEPEAKEDGTECDDGRFCTINDKCQDGKCVGKERKCAGKNDDPPCVTSQCDEKAKKCIKKVNAGVKCSDGDKCTVDDTCNIKGKCKGKPKKCADPGQCQRAKCNSKTGECEPINKKDNIRCDDDNKCTFNDRCQDGVCTPAKTKECKPKECKTGVCNPLSGKCNYDPVDDDTPCDDDNPCTENDTCISGMCTGTPVECPEQECKIAKCDPYEGCIYKDAPVGTPCNDNNNCTDNDVCKIGGVCEGVEKTCPPLPCQIVVECDPILGCIYADDPTCCLTPPPSDGLNNSVGWGNNCTDVPSGSVCVAPCSENFFGKYTAICNNGTWDISGGCGTECHSTITVTIQDCAGNPVPGATVTLVADFTDIVYNPPLGVTDASGQVVITGTASCQPPALRSQGRNLLAPDFCPEVCTAILNDPNSQIIVTASNIVLDPSYPVNGLTDIVIQGGCAPPLECQVSTCDPTLGCIYTNDPTCCFDPPPSTGLSNSLGWGSNCTAVPSGSVCAAPCAANFFGGYTATCNNGVWDIAGGCGTECHSTIQVTVVDCNGSPVPNVIFSLVGYDDFSITPATGTDNAGVVTITATNACQPGGRKLLATDFCPEVCTAILNDSNTQLVPQSDPGIVLDPSYPVNGRTVIPISPNNCNGN